MKAEPGGPEAVPADPTDELARRVVSADDARQFAQQALEVVVSVSGGRGAALMALESGHPVPFAALAIDSLAPALADSLWARFRPSLEQGEPLCVAERATDPRLAGSECAGSAAFILAPVFDSEFTGLVITGRELVALLYLEGDQAALCSAENVQRLAKYGRLLARPIVERTPVDEAEPAPSDPGNGNENEATEEQSHSDPEPR